MYLMRPYHYVLVEFFNNLLFNQMTSYGQSVNVVSLI